MSGSRWSLDPSEVSSGISGHTATDRRRRSRASRAVDRRDLQLTLIHRPTGLEVSGQIPEGRYSRQEMTRLRDALYRELFDELEALVAKRLRIPGR